MKQRTDAQEMAAWLDNIPDIYHGKFRREWLKAACRQSLRAAVNAKCRDCSNWQNTEIRDCTVITCPLWQYRPFARTPGEQAKRAGIVLGFAQGLSDEFVSQTSTSEQSGAQNDEPQANLDFTEGE